jgi:chromosome partitioning protein
MVIDTLPASVGAAGDIRDGERLGQAAPVSQASAPSFSCSAEPTLKPHTIALLSQKGGPGKTTTSVNLAAALAQAGHPSLVIDMDPQRAAGRCLGVSLTSSSASIYTVLLGEKMLRDVIIHTDSDVYLAPSHPDLAALSFDTRASREARLKLAIEALRGDNAEPRFEFILVDCPPDLDVLPCLVRQDRSANALMAASHVIIPVEPEPLSLFTLEDVLLFVRDVRLLNTRLQVMGFVLNKVSDRRQAQVKQTMVVLGAMPHPVLGQVRDSAYLVRAPETGRTIFQVAPTSAVADDYRHLVEVVVNGRK